MIQDARLLFDASRSGARFAHAPHVGARYRVVSGSLSRRNPTQFWRDVLVNGARIEALWRGRDALSSTRLQALAGVYDSAARGLFTAGHPDYFDAVARQRKLGLPLPRPASSRLRWRDFSVFARPVRSSRSLSPSERPRRFAFPIQACASP